MSSVQNAHEVHEEKLLGCRRYRNLIATNALLFGSLYALNVSLIILSCCQEHNNMRTPIGFIGILWIVNAVGVTITTIKLHDIRHFHDFRYFYGKQ